MEWSAYPATRSCLEAALRRLNGLGPPPDPGFRLDAWLGRPSRRLAVYGSLAPGQPNHHHLASLRGEWRAGFVHGAVETVGAGVDMGFLALTWCPEGSRVPVRLFTSDGLPRQLARLDAFEGGEYRRTLIPVDLPRGDVVVAQVYTRPVPRPSPA